MCSIEWAASSSASTSPLRASGCRAGSTPTRSNGHSRVDTTSPSGGGSAVRLPVPQRVGGFLVAQQRELDHGARVDGPQGESGRQHLPALGHQPVETLDRDPQRRIGVTPDRQGDRLEGVEQFRGGVHQGAPRRGQATDSPMVPDDQRGAEPPLQCLDALGRPGRRDGEFAGCRRIASDDREHDEAAKRGHVDVEPVHGSPVPPTTPCPGPPPNASRHRKRCFHIGTGRRRYGSLQRRLEACGQPGCTTVMPGSAPIQRRFSAAGRILSRRRGHGRRLRSSSVHTRPRPDRGDRSSREEMG